MLSGESIIGILFNTVVGYIVDVYDHDDEKNIAYFWVTGFLTALIFISFLCTVGLAMYDKEFNYVLTKGYEQELSEEVREQTLLGNDVS